MTGATLLISLTGGHIPGAAVYARVTISVRKRPAPMPARVPSNREFACASGPLPIETLRWSEGGRNAVIAA